jgi:23S rRNA (cytidine2498-2'-O)-methyltransferase
VTPRAAYLAAEGLEAPLTEEAARRGATLDAWHGRLVTSPDPPQHLAWAEDTWLAPRLVTDPAELLTLAPRWTALRMEDEAPGVAKQPNRRLHFPTALPAASGGFTTVAPGQWLASPTRASRFPAGNARFFEDAEGPPSRAYLKLWEALTLLGAHPVQGDLCYDLGAAPGGWTWAIAKLGARVVAIDKAAVAPNVAAMLGVKQRLESAFALDPRAEPRLDWLVCDVIAYPTRTLALVRRWLDSGRVAHIVASVKFQGPTDHDTAEAFAAIPGGRLLHLSHNKHELTFLWPFPPMRNEEPT